MSDQSKVLGLVLCLAASVVVFATTADGWDDLGYVSTARRDWALACGVASAALCLMRLILIKFNAGMPPAVDTVLSIMLVVMWVFAAGFSTSAKGIFPATGNGYFGTWAALLASLFYASASISRVQDLKETEASSQTKGFIVSFVLSLIEFAVAADQCHEDSDCTKKKGWAVAVGVISFSLCLFQLILLKVGAGLAETFGKVLALLLLGLWSAGAGSNTSSTGPFNNACGGGGYGSANGYFSTWMALFGALYVVFVTYFPQTQESNPSVPYSQV